MNLYSRCRNSAISTNSNKTIRIFFGSRWWNIHHNAIDHITNETIILCNSRQVINYNIYNKLIKNIQNLIYYRFQKHKMLLLLFQLLLAISYFGMVFIKPVDRIATVNYYYQSSFEYCPSDDIRQIDKCNANDLSISLIRNSLMNLTCKVSDQ